MKSHILFPSQILQIQAGIDFCTDEENGAISLFIGNVRSENKSKKVNKLFFECYISLAEKETERIINQACQQWNLSHVWIEHRLGDVPVLESAVVIVVGSKHRKDSLAASKYLIDTLKKEVPIWKKEYYDDGEIWIQEHP